MCCSAYCYLVRDGAHNLKVYQFFSAINFCSDIHKQQAPAFPSSATHPHTSDFDAVDEKSFKNKASENCTKTWDKPSTPEHLF